MNMMKTKTGKHKISRLSSYGIMGFCMADAAVVISNGDYGWKHMKAGKPGQVYIDLLGNRDEQIVIGEDGWADFTCNGNSVSVWIPMEN